MIANSSAFNLTATSEWRCADRAAESINFPWWASAWAALTVRIAVRADSRAPPYWLNDRCTRYSAAVTMGNKTEYRMTVEITKANAVTTSNTGSSRYINAAMPMHITPALTIPTNEID